jgi:hypothetical protein
MSNECRTLMTLVQWAGRKNNGADEVIEGEGGGLKDTDLGDSMRDHHKLAVMPSQKEERVLLSILSPTRTTISKEERSICNISRDGMEKWM